MGIFVKTEALHDRWKAFHAAAVVESEIVDYGEIFKEWIFLRDISDVLFELCRIFRGNLSAVFDETGVRLISAGKHTQQSGFATAVCTDNSDNFS